MGAVNGAIIAGNAPGARVDRLCELWRPGERGWFEPDETTRRTAATLETLIGGRPGQFAPIGPLGSWWLPDPGAGARGLYDTAALVVDVEDGREHLFDTAGMQVRPKHVRASTALPPALPPIEVDGRLFADAGLSANLPLDSVLAASPAARTLCIAADLLPLSRARPRTLRESVQLRAGPDVRRAVAPQHRALARTLRPPLGRGAARGHAGPPHPSRSGG